MVSILIDILTPNFSLTVSQNIFQQGIVYICIMFFNCTGIKERMNEAGKEKKPFLFAVDFELREGFFVQDPLSQRDVLFNVKGISNILTQESTIPPEFHSPSRHHPEAIYRDPTTLPETYRFDTDPESYHSYAKRFNIVMDGLRRGDSYLTNLTIKTPVRSSLSLEEIFHYSRAAYKLYLPGRWVCFSPECFVRIEKGTIHTFPMKGTIDAQTSNAQDIILNDPKETAEHNTIVDLLRNDLSRIATSVKVNCFRYIDKLETNRGPILQVSSEIEGTLPEDYPAHIGTLFFELLPAGSVSGAPKEATIRIIREAENEPRGFYTGVAGYFDGETLESFVLIRFIEQSGSQLFFRSGGGITANSNSNKEYEEAIRKVYLPF